jgi:hypothetical protein
MPRMLTHSKLFVLDDLYAAMGVHLSETVVRRIALN